MTSLPGVLRPSTALPEPTCSPHGPEGPEPGGSTGAAAEAWGALAQGSRAPPPKRRDTRSGRAPAPCGRLLGALQLVTTRLGPGQLLVQSQVLRSPRALRHCLREAVLAQRAQRLGRAARAGRCCCEEAELSAGLLPRVLSKPAHLATARPRRRALRSIRPHSPSSPCLPRPVQAAPSARPPRLPPHGLRPNANRPQALGWCPAPGEALPQPPTNPHVAGGCKARRQTHMWKHPAWSQTCCLGRGPGPDTASGVESTRAASRGREQEGGRSARAHAGENTLLRGGGKAAVW